MSYGRLCIVFLGVCSWGLAGELRSGLTPGQRPGPYSAVIVTGPQRGQSCCYICETGDKPAVVLFARTLSAPLGKLVHRIDRTMADPKMTDLRGWVTFLSDNQPDLDPKIVQWSQHHAIRSVPLGVFEDAGGPPAYRLAGEADVTVLLFVKQKVVANFTFRTGELTDDKIAEVMKSLAQIRAR